MISDHAGLRPDPTTVTMTDGVSDELAAIMFTARLRAESTQPLSAGTALSVCLDYSFSENLYFHHKILEKNNISSSIPHKLAN